SLILPHQLSTLFPYTTLFRSCMYDKTALAQAEVEYEEERTQSVYVKFPLVAPLREASNAPKPSLVIWTTTPWTLPANLAIAVHRSEEHTSELQSRGHLVCRLL